MKHRLGKASRNMRHFKYPVEVGDDKFIEKQTYMACDSINDQSSGAQRWNRQITAIIYCSGFAC